MLKASKVRHQGKDVRELVAQSIEEIASCGIRMRLSGVHRDNFMESYPSEQQIGMNTEVHVTTLQLLALVFAFCSHGARRNCDMT